MYCKNRIKQLLIITVLFILVLSSGCAASKQEEPAETKELVEATTDLPQIVTVVKGSIDKSEYYDGEINPSMQVLQFPRTGVFLEYRVSLGSKVEKDQVIAVTQPEYEQQIETLTEQIDGLKTDYNNTVTNYDMQITTHKWKTEQIEDIMLSMSPEMGGFHEISTSFELMIMEGMKVEVQKEQYMERAQKEIAFQEERLKRMQEKNESNVIVAPEAGTITYLADFQVGDSVGVNSYPVVLADTGKYLVQCEYIDGEDMENMAFSYAVKDGKRYDLQYIPYEDGEYERKKAKEEGVYTYFELVNADDSIQFGEDIKVITVEEYKEDVLIVPSDCIRVRDGKPSVYLNNNGKKELVFIETGSEDDINTEVISGLQEGDKIYASN